MDMQTAFNIAVGLAGAFGGFFLKSIWDAIKDVQTADTAMAADITSLKVLVAGNYVTRNEYRDDMSGIKDALKRIEDKLDGKADKAK